MRCTGCNKEIPFLAMHPVAIRDNNGKIIRPRQTQLFCDVCMGFEKITPRYLEKKKRFVIF